MESALEMVLDWLFVLFMKLFVDGNRTAWGFTLATVMIVLVMTILLVRRIEHRLDHT